jgi:hypothetical protein
VYNPVKLSVVASPLLVRSQYVVHAGLLLAYLSVISAYFHLVTLLYLLPILLVQGVHLKKLRLHRLAYCQSRQWQFYNGQARLKRQEDWVAVEVRAHQVWPLCVILQYRNVPFNPLQKADAWQWDIIMADACDPESHRQLVALMRHQYQFKEE